MPASELTALLLFATAMSFSPGPNTTLSAALAANHGLAHAMRFVCAVPVGWALLLVGCAVGLGGLIQAVPVLQGVIKWAGLGYMLFLAWKLWRTDSLSPNGASARLDVSFGQGVLLQFVNVKAWLNALLISAGWVTTADNTVQRLAIVLPLMMFYGLASKEMAGYWHFIDDVWVKTPEYAGCGFGYLRRWTPERLKQAREFIDKAEKACGTKRERDRVQLASWSLTLFEKFMQMRRDLAAGEWGTLTNQVSEYRDLLIDLGEQYQAEYAFSRMGWTGKNTLNVRYFDAFYKETHEDASRIASKFDVLTIPPMRTWKYQKDQDKKGEANGWAKADFADGAWKATDVAVDTWSALGMHNYMGSVWYRKSVNLSKAAAGKKTFLWIGATDGRVKVFVNGQHVQHIDAKGMKQDSFTGHCQPASFDISAAIKDGENRISLWCTREIVNELGTGGLIAAPVVYREK